MKRYEALSEAKRKPLLERSKAILEQTGSEGKPPTELMVEEGARRLLNTASGTRARGMGSDTPYHRILHGANLLTESEVKASRDR